MKTPDILAIIGKIGAKTAKNRSQTKILLKNREILAEERTTLLAVVSVGFLTQAPRQIAGPR